MKFTTAILALASVPVLLLALTGATSQEKPQEKKPAATTAPAGTYAVDKVHSTVLFKCKHLDVSWFYGRFDDVTGKITLDPAKPESSKVEITIQAASVNSNDKKREEHL